MFSQFQEDGDDGFQGLLSLTLWDKLSRIAVFRNGERKERGEPWHRVLDGKPVLAQRVFEFPNFSSGVFSAWNRNSRWNKSITGKSAVFSK